MAYTYQSLILSCICLLFLKPYENKKAYYLFFAPHIF